jgi:transcriptional regulator with XRE-family HTH domain
MTSDHDDSALPAPRPPEPVRGQFHDGLEAAERAEFTRPVPKGAAAQFRFLLARAKGSTVAVAARLGISRRTVQRYAAGKLRRPQKALQATLAEETARDWQPGVRARVREQAASSGGLLIEARARFGFRAALGSTDDPRMRLIRQTVSPDHAGRLLAARERCATEAELQELVAQALGYAYFGNFGELAKGVEVVFTDVDYIDFRF